MTARSKQQKRNGNGRFRKSKKPKRKKPPISQQCDPSGLQLIRVVQHRRRKPGTTGRKTIEVTKHVRNCPGVIPF